MAAPRGGRGPGSALGCIALVVIGGGLVYFGPGILARLGVTAPGPLVEWGAAHEGDGLRVAVVAAELGTTEIEDTLGTRDGSFDLQVTLEIRNVDPDRAAVYRTPRLLRAKEPALADDKGKEIPRPAYGEQAKVVGELADGTRIEPRESETHLLVFREPAAGASHFVLTLDLAMFDRKGVARFRIPAQKVRGLR